MITDGEGNPCLSYLCCICQFWKMHRLWGNLWRVFKQISDRFPLKQMNNDSNYIKTMKAQLPKFYPKIKSLEWHSLFVLFISTQGLIFHNDNVSPCWFLLLFIFKQSFSLFFLFPFSLFISCFYLFLEHWTIVQALEYGQSSL